MAETAEQLRVLQQLGRTYRAFLSAYEKQVGHFLPRWRVMLHLYQRGKPTPQKDVGEASYMDPGALSRQLSALEALGWIRRDTDSNDKRVTNVSLTEQGRREVEKSLPKRTAFMEEMLQDVSEKQLRQLMDSLLLLETRFNASTRKEEDAPRTS